jgi:hypothetical protein
MGGLAVLRNGRAERLAIGHFLRHFKGMNASARAPLLRRFRVASMMESRNSQRDARNSRRHSPLNSLAVASPSYRERIFVTRLIDRWFVDALQRWFNWIE